MTMNWDHILSIQPDNIHENEIEDLYNAVAWFDLNDNDIDLNKAFHLLKINQELLKLKGGQVETLLYKLDELAARHGEDEIRKVDSDTDARSSRSRKSNSLDFENLERKYFDLKAAYKKQTRSCEKQSTEITQLKKQLTDLERDKSYLISELDAVNDNESQSDSSRTNKDRYNELVEQMQIKNRQISELLHDVEEIEQDNVGLREKLTFVKDELSNAVQEITNLSNTLENTHIEQSQLQESLSKFVHSNKLLQEDLVDALKQKESIEQQVSEFTDAANSKLNKWVQVMNKKEEALRKLQNEQTDVHLSSTTASTDQCLVFSHINSTVYNKEMLNLKNRLWEVTNELEACNGLVKKLQLINGKQKQKISDLTESTKQDRKLLKLAQERCITLQDSVQFAEYEAQTKSSDLNGILSSLKDGGNAQLYENLALIQQLKSQNRVLQSELVRLVRFCNKIQGNNDSAKTNASRSAKWSSNERFLRKQMPIDSERLPIDANNVLLALYNKYSMFDVHSEKQLKTRRVSTKSKRLEIENVNVEKFDESNRSEENMFDQPERDEVMSQQDKIGNDSFRTGFKPDINTSVSINNLKHCDDTTRENEDNIIPNKTELGKLQTYNTIEPTENRLITLDNATDIITIKNILKNIYLKMSEYGSDAYEHNLQMTKEQLQVYCLQIELLYKEYRDSNERFANLQKDYIQKIDNMELENQTNEEKISLLSRDISDDNITKELLELTEHNVYLKRRSVRLENEVSFLNKEIITLREEVISAKITYTGKIQNLIISDENFSQSISHLGKKLCDSMECQRCKELRDKNLNITMKYRQLLKDFQSYSQQYQSDVKLLEKLVDILKDENSTLKHDIENWKNECIHSIEGKSPNNTAEKMQQLQNKLVATEANELNEKQRADHFSNIYAVAKAQVDDLEKKNSVQENRLNEVNKHNLLLQKQYAEFESKIVNSLSNSDYKTLEMKHLALVEQNGRQCVLLKESKDGINTLLTQMANMNLWNDFKEQELLYYKQQSDHITDDTIELERCRNELKASQLHENEMNNQIQNLQSELYEWKNIYTSIKDDCEKLRVQYEACNNNFDEKIRLLEEIISYNVSRYYGSIPIQSIELFKLSYKEMMQSQHAVLTNEINSQLFERHHKLHIEQYQNELNIFAERLKANAKDEDMLHCLETHQQNISLLKENIEGFKMSLRTKDQLTETLLEKMFLRDSTILNLQEELLEVHTIYGMNCVKTEQSEAINTEHEYKKEIEKISQQIQTDFIEKVFASKEQQTIQVDENVQSKPISSDHSNHESCKELIDIKKAKIVELEGNISSLKSQIEQQDIEIKSYKNDIQKLQHKDEDDSGNKNVLITEEIHNLKTTILTLENQIIEKTGEISKYEALLKEDRDKHSFAASSLQDELKLLRHKCNELKQANNTLRSMLNETSPNKVALERYFSQVHILESELSSFRTKCSAYEIQLKSTREESVRWRSLANDRLISMEQLATSLRELHRNEIMQYKSDSKKWQEEVTNLKHLICTYKESNGAYNDIETEDKMTIFSNAIAQDLSEPKMVSDNFEKSHTDLLDVQNALNALQKEHDVLRKRYNNLVKREKKSKDELMDLKEQLFKRPISSTRSEKTDRQTKEQLKKRITSLEAEIVILQDNLSSQVTMKESQRIKANEEFNRWCKQKHWQQMVEKLKSTLKSKENELRTLQQACANYKTLIDRLEKEKHGFQARIKKISSDVDSKNENALKKLEDENRTLIEQLEALRRKTSIHENSANGLGVKMLEEKLQMQERKIAVLELTAKGPMETRSEIERLQMQLITLQESNFYLESQILQLKDQIKGNKSGNERVVVLRQ